MRARVKAQFQHLTVYAIGRIAFHHHEWTEVPAGREDEVMENPLLETDEQPDEQPAEMVMKHTRRKAGR